MSIVKYGIRAIQRSGGGITRWLHRDGSLQDHYVGIRSYTSKVRASNYLRRIRRRKAYSNVTLSVRPYARVMLSQFSVRRKAS